MLKNPNKYAAVKMTIDGITFDSRKEARRYSELKLLESAGEITDLKLQVPFLIIEALYEESDEVYTRGSKKGQHRRGKCIERPAYYIADFVYTEVATGKQIIEDAKGVRTKDYILKRKLVRKNFGKDFEFREV